MAQACTVQPELSGLGIQSGANEDAAFSPTEVTGSASELEKT
jgi:hypothetical protein